MTPAPAFTSAAQATDLIRAGLTYLAAADPTQMTAAEQARCLQDLEQVTAIQTAAQASVLGAFTAGKGYCDDAAYSPRSWLIHQTRISKGAATGLIAWVRRARAHPRILAAMAAGELSESWARTLCQWTDQLPEGSQDDADAILAGAAAGGLDLRDLAALAAQMQTRADPGPDDDPGKSFDDRAVKLETTFGGAGVMSGDLSPECTAVLATVLEALSAPRGAEDTRSHEQRYHDALEEALRRLVAAGLLPERAGQPAKVWAHISLADLLDLDKDSTLQQEWTARVRDAWAAHRAAASVSGSDGAAWLEGEAAEGFACDASLVPVVTGDINPEVLEHLVRLCVQLAGHGHGCIPAPGGPAQAPGSSTLSGPADCGDSAPGTAAAPVPLSALSRDALEQKIIGAAVDLVSGPGGLASFLRRRELGARLAGPSLPLDIGYSEDIPAGIRNAVRLRDLKCRWAGGCDQPASACEVHHLKHKSRGGKTSRDGCILLCFYHHQIVIHRMGWTLVLNRDGTTTAFSPDRRKVLHSHGPPARAG